MKRKMLKLYSISTLDDGSVVLETDVGLLTIKRQSRLYSSLNRYSGYLSALAQYQLAENVHIATLEDIPESKDGGLAF